MLDYKKQRQLIIGCVLAIVVVVILSILYLISIWKPEPEKEKVYEVGNVELVEMDEEKVLKEYYKKISDMLMNSKTDEILNLVAEDYMKYYNYTIDDIKAYIENKNILNKKLELSNGQAYLVDGYSSVYSLDIKAMGEIYSLNIVIREKSPDNYTIAFDKFIDYKEHTYSGVSNSVELRVQKRARFTNSVEYRVRVTNNYDNSISINTNKEADGVILANANDGTIKNPILLSFTNQIVTLEPGFSKEFDVAYSMEEELDFYAYNVLLLKGVTYSGLNGTSNLEFYMNK